ncbi:MAG: hypothetical protein JW761_11550, partial [Prolixibacteraceae bacterium]|nr:hypothetical protein [Prolixibacteraceae bacterium]
PATSVTVLNDLPGSHKKTVWFNSRFYRANLLSGNGVLWFRDIHLFDENMASPYLTEKGTSNQCLYFSLPFVDGYFWSSAEKTGGLYFKATKNGQEVVLNGEKLTTSEPENGTLKVSWELNNQQGTFHILMDENTMEIALEASEKLDWFLELNTIENAELPFTLIQPKKADMQFSGVEYSVEALTGSFSVSENGRGFLLAPAENKIVLNFSGKRLM